MIRSVALPAMNRRTVMFTIAALLAIGTGWLTFSYLTSVNRSVTAAVTPQVVVVASRDIPARATIAADMLVTMQRPANAVDPDSIASPALAVGSVARVTIPAGSAVTSSKFGRALDVGLTLRLHPGKRAISIPIDRVKAVANLIQPGDHVDVIALTRAEPGLPPRALTILRNTVVLAMGLTYESTGATPAPDTQTSTVTLEVAPADAQLLALADVNTTLRLALRTPKEPNGRAAPDRLLLGGLPLPTVPAALPAAVTARAALPVAPARPQAPAPGVTVVDGDRIIGSR